MSLTICLQSRLWLMMALVTIFLFPGSDRLHAKENNRCMITAAGIDPIHLGMTLHDARRAFPDADFRRTSDGEGAALISVSVGKTDWMHLYAEEEDAEAPINWNNTIRFIETFQPACKTVHGIYPGMLIRDVEKRLGKTKIIIESEIESRQFIEFHKQPPGFLFRLDYTGVFPDGARRTKTFAPDAKILSITVMPQ